MSKQSRTARQYLADKPRRAVAIEPEASVLSALKLLADEDIGAVLVVSGSRLVGILSERDFARKCDLQGRSARDALVREIMSTDVTTVGPDHTFEQCMVLMHRHRLRHLPVIDADRIVGVLSSKDILEQMLAGEQHRVKDLVKDRLQIVGDTGGSY